MVSVKFGFNCLPDLPVAKCIRLAKLCEKYDFHSFWVADEIYHKDPWIVMAMAAANTKKIKIGPGVTHMFLRNPAYIAQSLATLDEVSSGRAFCAISTGNILMLEQCHVKTVKPIGALREAVEVIRLLLKGGPINYNGQFFKYSGIFTSSKPLQEKVPILIGGMAGPLSFRLAGEIGDGATCSIACSPQFNDYVMENIRIGAQKAKRSLEEFDVADWLAFSIHKDGDLARKVSRPVVAFYSTSMPPSQLEKHGINKNRVKRISDSIIKGDIPKAIDLTTNDMVNKLSISGSPDEVINKLERDLAAHGINHFMLCPFDNTLMKALLGITIKGALTIEETLMTCHKYVMPQFKDFEVKR